MLIAIIKVGNKTIDQRFGENKQKNFCSKFFTFFAFFHFFCIKNAGNIQQSNVLLFGITRLRLSLERDREPSIYSRACQILTLDFSTTIRGEIQSLCTLNGSKSERRKQECQICIPYIQGFIPDIHKALFPIFIRQCLFLVLCPPPPQTPTPLTLLFGDLLLTDINISELSFRCSDPARLNNVAYLFIFFYLLGANQKEHRLTDVVKRDGDQGNE